MKSYKSKSSFQGTHSIHADPPLMPGIDLVVNPKGCRLPVTPN
ncbi:MAG: hypothetical protein ACTSUE_05780 [Promethearchaeota archaeon]